MEGEFDFTNCQYAGGACKTAVKCLVLELLRQMRNEEMQDEPSASEKSIDEKIKEAEGVHCGRFSSVQKYRREFRFNRRSQSQPTSSE